MKISLTLTLLLAGSPALAQTYPAKPIHIVVGSVGGGFDIAARLLAQKLRESWGQPVLVDNKVGGDSIIATDFVAKSAPDGYTLLVNGNGGMVVNPVLYAKLPYDAVRDFAPISQLLVYPYLLMVHASVPVSSLQEFLAYARANPGKLNYSAGSRGFQLANEMFQQMSGTRITFIPYKGAATAFAGLLGGEVQMALVDIGQAVSTMNTGRLKVLGVSSPARVPSLPDVPTLSEAGVPNYVFEGWSGVFAPAGSPGPIVTRLNAEIVRIANVPDVREKLVVGGAVLKTSTPEQFAATVRNDIDKYRPIVKAVNMKLE